MKKIIINGRFLLHRITGVERYAREILFELDKIVPPGQLEMAVPPETTELPVYENIAIVKTGRLHNRLWEHISFPGYVKKCGGISLNLCNVAPLPSPGIVCIHDMKVKAFPHFYSKSFRLWYEMLFDNEMRRAKALITVSEFSKSEIMKYFRVDAGRIHVVPDAWQHFLRIGYEEGALEKYGLRKNDFYFAMGSMEPNKNFRWIAMTARKNPNQTFAVSGAFNSSVFADGMGFECPGNMKLLGYVTDEEAKTLMRDCKAFLFPTIYEGFGIPPLEALSAGAQRVLVSDTEVMHEIFGDSVEYIDPFSCDYVLDDAGAPGKYGRPDNRKAVLEKYSWRKSAEILYEIIRKGCVESEKETPHRY